MSASNPVNSSILHLRLSANNGTITLSHPIPSQIINLTQVRVEMSGQNLQPVLYVNLSPIFGSSQINNSVERHSYLPVLLDNGPITVTNPNFDIQTQTIINERFQYEIYDITGDLVNPGQFVSMDLVFNYGLGGIV